MGTVGYQQLVDSLTAPHVPRSVAPPPKAPASDAAAPPAPGTVGAASPTVGAGADQANQSVGPLKPTTTTPPGVDPAAPKVIQAFDPSPEYLRLDDCEREFMKRLHPLIPSPRAAKRFVNVYRLLRTTVGENEKTAFVAEDKQGEYQSVQLLLAVQTGYPNEAMEIIRDLIEQSPEGSWWTFVEGYARRYAPRPTKRPASRSANAARRVQPEVVTGEPEGTSWLEFLERLNHLRPAMPDVSCRGFVKWSPRVARYSFQSARALQFASPPSRKLSNDSR